MKGKVVLVTGANGGLGTYVTQAFLDAGATVVGTSRKIQQSDFNNSNFTALPAEISTREGAQTLVGQIVERFGKLIDSTRCEAGKDVNGSVIPVYGKDA